jgi:hypothetical protein
VQISRQPVRRNPYEKRSKQGDKRLPVALKAWLPGLGSLMKPNKRLRPYELLHRAIFLSRAPVSPNLCPPFLAFLKFVLPQIVRDRLGWKSHFVPGGNRRNSREIVRRTFNEFAANACEVDFCYKRARVALATPSLITGWILIRGCE